MESLYSPRTRAEQLIAACRVALAIFSLFAIWLDPSEPAKYAAIAYSLLAAYVVYALLMAAYIWATTAELEKVGRITHIVDIIVFTSFIYFTEGPTSPFFVYIIFSVYCGAVRWQQSGTLLTALAVLSLFIGMGIYMEVTSPEGEFQLNPFIIRCVSLTIVALLLSYLTSYEHRVRNELTNLAKLPFGEVASYEPETFIRETLKYAAAVLRAPRIVMVWDEEEEPFRHVSSLSQEGFQWNLEPPSVFDPVVAEELHATDFLCLNANAPTPKVLQSADAGLRRWLGAPLNPKLTKRFGIKCVVAANLIGKDFQGHLLFLDKPGMTSDDLILGGIVGHQVTAFLTQLYGQQRLQQSAVTSERIKMSRDLHDGVLQSLTGIALQLEMVRRMMGKDTRAPVKQLEEIQTLIIEEQRGLRSFIQQLKAETFNPAGQTLDLNGRLNDLADKIERQWGVDVELRMEPAEARLPECLAQEIHLLTKESLVNSARHARATSIRATIAVANGKAHIAVLDDGQGFPFQGRYNLDEMTTQGIGPRSLKGRITSLGGQLTIDSRSNGACLEMSFSLRPYRTSSAPQTDVPVDGIRAFKEGSRQ
ncbi:MAG: histidine kinase [Pseudomonadota bacterium]